jgi:hypothetical protein
MTLTPRLRKLALTAHVTSSVGWLGAVAGFLALAVAGLTSQDAQTVRAAYLAMELTGWSVIVPLSFASLLTGLVQSLGTEWGLFRHHWVLFKLAINVFANIVLLMYMRTLDHFAGIAADTTSSGGDLRMLRDPSPVLHASLALALLLVAVTLAVYKPRGMTRYGARKHGHASTSSTPGWVRVFAIIAFVVFLLFVVLLLSGGPHGPGRHTGGDGSHAPPPSDRQAFLTQALHQPLAATCLPAKS